MSAFFQQVRVENDSSLPSITSALGLYSINIACRHNARQIIDRNWADLADSLRLVGSGGYHLLRAIKTCEIVNVHRYHQQLIKLHRLRKKVALSEKTWQADFPPRQQYRIRQQCQNLETLNWEVLPHPAYSPNLAPSDYHLFSSMGHALAERHFDSYEDKNGLMSALKDEEFFWRSIYKLPERWEKCIFSEGKYFE